MRETVRGQALSDLLGMLITLDDVLQRLGHVPDSLVAYRRMVANMLLEPSRYGCEATALQQLDARLASVDDELLRGSTFRRCPSQPWRCTPSSGV